MPARSCCGLVFRASCLTPEAELSPNVGHPSGPSGLPITMEVILQSGYMLVQVQPAPLQLGIFFFLSLQSTGLQSFLFSVLLFLSLDDLADEQCCSMTAAKNRSSLQF